MSHHVCYGNRQQPKMQFRVRWRGEKQCFWFIPQHTRPSAHTKIDSDHVCNDEQQRFGGLYGVPVVGLHFICIHKHVHFPWYHVKFQQARERVKKGTVTTWLEIGTSTLQLVSGKSSQPAVCTVILITPVRAANSRLRESCYRLIECHKTKNAAGIEISPPTSQSDSGFPLVPTHMHYVGAQKYTIPTHVWVGTICALFNLSCAKTLKGSYKDIHQLLCIRQVEESQVHSTSEVHARTSRKFRWHVLVRVLTIFFMCKYVGKKMTLQDYQITVLVGHNTEKQAVERHWYNWTSSFIGKSSRSTQNDHR